MGKHTVVAVDVAKAVFEVAVSEEPGRIKRHRRLSRGELEIFFVQTPRATVVMKACGSAHHWGRRLQAQGHEVVLLPPHQVRPYVTRNKTDRRAHDLDRSRCLRRQRPALSLRSPFRKLLGSHSS